MNLDGIANNHFRIFIYCSSCDCSEQISPYQFASLVEKLNHQSRFLLFATFTPELEKPGYEGDPPLKAAKLARALRFAR